MGASMTSLPVQVVSRWSGSPEINGIIWDITIKQADEQIFFAGRFKQCEMEASAY